MTSKWHVQGTSLFMGIPHLSALTAYYNLVDMAAKVIGIVDHVNTRERSARQIETSKSISKE